MKKKLISALVSTSVLCGTMTAPIVSAEMHFPEAIDSYQYVGTADHIAPEVLGYYPDVAPEQWAIYTVESTPSYATVEKRTFPLHDVYLCGNRGASIHFVIETASDEESLWEDAVNAVLEQYLDESYTVNGYLYTTEEQTYYRCDIYDAAQKDSTYARSAALFEALRNEFTLTEYQYADTYLERHLLSTGGALYEIADYTGIVEELTAYTAENAPDWTVRTYSDAYVQLCPNDTSTTNIEVLKMAMDIYDALGYHAMDTVVEVACKPLLYGQVDFLAADTFTDLTWTNWTATDDHGMLDSFVWNGTAIPEYNVYLKGQGSIYVVTPNDNRFVFVLRDDIDAAAAEEIVAPLLESCIPADDTAAFFESATTTEGTVYYIVYGTDIATASAAYKALTAQELISAFYDCGQNGDYQSISHKGLTTYSTDIDVEALEAYIAENYPDCTVAYTQEDYGYEAGEAYCVVPNESISTDEHFEMAACIYRDLGIRSLYLSTDMAHPPCYGINTLTVTANGDTNLDSTVDSTDALIALQEYVQVSVMEEAATLSYTQNLAADLDGNGVVSADDALAILSLYVSSMR